MNSKNRTVLFFSFVALFFLAAPTLVLYSQGYRVNWPPVGGQKLVVKTGGIFVKATPKQADVYINGNLAKKTDFFFGSCLVENLLPRNYEVAVKKDGYQSWQKTLPVQEKQVTEAKRIVLFPQTLTLSALAKNIDSFFPSPDSSKIALKQNSSQGWELSIYDINNNVLSQLATEDDFSKSGGQIQSLDWAKDSLSINLVILDGGQKKYFIIGAQIAPSKPESTLAPASDAPTGSLAFASSGLTQYYIGPDGIVFKKDPLESAPAKVSETPLPTDKDIAYKLWVFAQFVFAKAGADLYLYQPGSTQFVKIFNDLESDVVLSPDAKKVAYASNSEIWTMYIREKTDQPKKSAGDKEFVARLSKKITGLSWFDSDYVIFLTGNSIKTAEIDDRGSVNIANLADIAGDQTGSPNPPTFAWNAADKDLFIFDGSTLYQAQVNTD